MSSQRARIAALAYGLWEKRGKPVGSPETDWHEAEKQLRGEPTDANAVQSNPRPACPTGCGRFNDDATRWADLEAVTQWPQLGTTEPRQRRRISLKKCCASVGSAEGSVLYVPRGWIIAWRSVDIRPCSGVFVTNPHREPERVIVGLGASAGGLAALKTFFSHVPEETGFTFVVVMHLSPEHESHLAELLQPFVKIPVTQVGETVAMEPDHVYVIPPGCNLSAVDSHLRLSDLETAAQSSAHRSIISFARLPRRTTATPSASILSGTGSDGALGLKAIRESGGLALVQDPDGGGIRRHAAQRHRDGSRRSRVAGCANAATSFSSYARTQAERCCCPRTKSSSEARHRASFGADRGPLTCAHRSRLQPLQVFDRRAANPASHADQSGRDARRYEDLLATNAGRSVEPCGRHADHRYQFLP